MIKTGHAGTLSTLLTSKGGTPNAFGSALRLVGGADPVLLERSNQCHFQKLKLP